MKQGPPNPDPLSLKLHRLLRVTSLLHGLNCLDSVARREAVPRKGFVNACVNSPTEVPQSPPPSRCFLEKGSCGQMWLFPDASLCLRIFTIVRPSA